MRWKPGVPRDGGRTDDERRRGRLGVVALACAAAVLLSGGVAALTSSSQLVGLLAGAGTFGAAAAGAAYLVRPRGFVAWLLVFAVAGASAGLVSWLLEPAASLAATVAEWSAVGIVLFLTDSWVLFRR